MRFLKTILVSDDALESCIEKKLLIWLSIVDTRGGGELRTLVEKVGNYDKYKIAELLLKQTLTKDIK